MDLKKQKKEKKIELTNRVLVCRSELIKIGVKKPIDKFALKYPAYVGDEKKKKRLNNLWYSYVTDEVFTKKLEAFVSFKKVQY